MKVEWFLCITILLNVIYGSAALQNESDYITQESCVSTCSLPPSNLKSPKNSVLGNIQCLISPYNDKCPSFQNATDHYRSSSPRSKTEEEEGWFLYHDYASNMTKISLNISWGPEHDITTNYVRGYHIRMSKTSGTLPVQYYEFNYCLNHTLSFSIPNHLSAVFSVYEYFNNNGSCNRRVEILPGDVYKAYIQSIPALDPPLEIPVKVPDCTHPTVAKSSPCVNKITSHIAEIFCLNTSVLFKYSLPVEYGGEAVLELCNSENECRSFVREIDLNWYVSVPKQWQIGLLDDAKFTITVRGSNQPSIFSIHKFSFEKCKHTIYSGGVIAAIVSPILIFLLVAVLLMIKFRKQIRRMIYKSHTNVPSEESHQLNTDNHNSITPIELRKKINCVSNLFLVYWDDHKLHRDVVLKLASYLQHLGFNVFCELFEQNEIFADRCDWMEKRMSQAEKVVIVWSAGAIDIWKKCQNQQDAFEVTNSDFFTPVVKKIKNDLIKESNLRKYCFVYFGYVKMKEIPTIFRELSGCHFQLMKQFQEFYFQLKDLEMYAPGMMLKQDDLSNPSKHSNGYQSSLIDAICLMNQFVEKHPDWFIRNENMYKTVSDSYFHFEDSETVMVNQLNLVKPPIIQLKSPKLNEKSELPSCNQTLTIKGVQTPNNAIPNLYTNHTVGMSVRCPVEHDDSSTPPNSLDSGYTTNFGAEPTGSNRFELECEEDEDQLEDQPILYSGIKETCMVDQPEAHSNGYSVNPPISLVPLDYKSDPWQSMATINNVSNT
uniref:SEFIR domain-containing protein n=1 Tax=Ciona intestinalis TaxID=7719 RepID=H2XLY8_CIOIN